MSTILFIFLLIVLIGALPSWPHSHTWGYIPSGILGVVIFLLLIPLILGRV